MKYYLTLFILSGIGMLYAQSLSECNFESDEYLILIGDTDKNIVLKSESSGTSLYVLSVDGQTNEETSRLTKYASTGDIAWEVSWEDSTYVSNFFIDQDRIFLTGFTRPFENGNSSVLIEIRDQGSSFSIVSSNTFDLSSQREATRGIIKLNSSITPYAMLLHKGWISIDDTQIALLDIDANIVDIKNYNLGDDQIWSGPVNDLDNTISIYGTEANDTQEGFLINAEYDLNNFEAFSFNGIGYIRDVSVDGISRQRILASQNDITLVDENYEILHSIDIPDATLNRQVEGPFIIAGVNNYIVFSQVNVTGENRAVITRLQVNQSNRLDVIWSKIIDIDGGLINGQANVILNGNIFQFSMGLNIINPLNGHGDTDFVIAEFDENSCSLIDFELRNETADVALVRQNMFVSDQIIPDMMPLNTIISNPYSCIIPEGCNPCANDIINPTCISQDISVYLDSNGEAIITADMIDNGSFDDCGEITLIIEGPTSFNCNNLGTQQTNLVVVDGSNNISFCTANITILDTIPPSIICTNSNLPVALNVNGLVNITSNDIAIQIQQNCDGRIGFEFSPSTFSCEDLGTNPITVTVFDESQNSTTCQTNVTIIDPDTSCVNCEIDNNPPIISCNSQVVTYEIGQNGMVNIDLDLHQFTASDDCGIQEIILGKPQLNCNDIGTIPQFTSVLVMDLNGNKSQCEIGYIVLDPKGYCIPESCDPSCFSDLVNLSTGIDNQENLLPVGQYVGNWELIDGPDPNLNYPRPGFVLQPNAAWDQLPGSQYISPFPNANNNGSFADPYVFERCFCVCQETAEIELNISAHVDNFINIGLFDENGNVIQNNLINFQGSSSTTTFRDPAFTSFTMHSLTQGTYCLRAELRNDGQVTMGMQINASVKNAGFISSTCCNPYTYIIGSVFQDVTCDTLNNINQDYGLEGIEVSLVQNGAVIETSTTDEFGYYVFNDMSIGSYDITVQSIPNNSLSAGVNGYSVIMTQDTIIGNLDFGFCKEKLECCASSDILSQTALDGLNSDVILFNEESTQVEIANPQLLDCQYVSTIYWGDGTSQILEPNSTIPPHTYNGNGAYLISFEVSSILSNEEVCQVDEVNHTVIINDCTVSIDFPNQTIGRIKMHPIPFNSSVNIEFSQPNHTYLIEVFDIAGQLVDNIQLPTNVSMYSYVNSNLIPGTYLFRISSADGTVILASKAIKI